MAKFAMKAALREELIQRQVAQRPYSAPSAAIKAETGCYGKGVWHENPGVQHLGKRFRRKAQLCGEFALLRGTKAEGRRASPGRPPARRFGRNLRLA